jgi:hypothetical protein
LSPDTVVYNTLPKRHSVYLLYFILPITFFHTTPTYTIHLKEIY